MNATTKPGLAFLQNMWMRDPERTKASIVKYGEAYRLRLVSNALFAGCVTGRRLKAAFGENVIEKITWEESTREIAGDPRSVFPPDPKHIREAIVKHQPKVIMAFGAIASHAVFAEITYMNWSGLYLSAAHPAARQSDVVPRLNQVAERFRKEIGL